MSWNMAFLWALSSNDVPHVTLRSYYEKSKAFITRQGYRLATLHAYASYLEDLQSQNRLSGELKDWTPPRSPDAIIGSMFAYRHELGRAKMMQEKCQLFRQWEQECRASLSIEGRGGSYWEQFTRDAYLEQEKGPIGRWYSDHWQMEDVRAEVLVEHALTQWASWVEEGEKRHLEAHKDGMTEKKWEEEIADLMKECRE